MLDLRALTLDAASRDRRTIQESDLAYTRALSEQHVLLALSCFHLKDYMSLVDRSRLQTDMPAGSGRSWQIEFSCIALFVTIVDRLLAWVAV